MSNLEKIKIDVKEIDSRANTCWYDIKILARAVLLILEELTRKPETFVADGIRYYKVADRKTEPQTDGYMTAEQAEDYRKMLDKAEHKVYGNIEDEPQTDLLVTEYPQDGEVTLIGRDKTEAVVMAYDVYKELTEPQTKCYLRTSCDHYGDKQVCGICREYNLYSHTKIEPQTDYKMPYEDCEDCETHLKAQKEREDK